MYASARAPLRSPHCGRPRVWARHLPQKTPVQWQKPVQLGDRSKGPAGSAQCAAEMHTEAYLRFMTCYVMNFQHLRTRCFDTAQHGFRSYTSACAPFQMGSVPSESAHVGILTSWTGRSLRGRHEPHGPRPALPRPEPAAPPPGLPVLSPTPPGDRTLRDAALHFTAQCWTMLGSAASRHTTYRTSSDCLITLKGPTRL